ncbi:uncharacterized protein LOC126575910 [Anopheles aquasalis]|uniref:uncharacterized protein LOC126575910 n=1 Tax=Anopheles aquasalis TaxID=42839 RepID=UPI00215A1A4C|nr:uncharacterized protein LOC126575910 [Anopheles aquasalis]
MFFYRIACLAQTKVINIVSRPALCQVRRTVYTNSPKNRSDVTKREKYFLQKDEIPLGFAIIYRAPMEYYLSACNIATSFSFLAMAGMSVFSILEDFRNVMLPFQMEYATLTTNEKDLLLFVGFFFLVNVIIRIVINRYPLRIYRQKKQYIAVFEGQIPLGKRMLKFHRGDVTVVPRSGILPWQDARYKINSNKVLLLNEYFRSPSELNIMLKS